MNIRPSHSSVLSVLICSSMVLITSILCPALFSRAQEPEKELVPKLFKYGTKNKEDSTEPELVVQSNHPGCVEAVAFSPDGSTLASASNRETKLWDIATAKQLRFLKAEPLFVSSVSFYPDGNFLLTGGFEATLWDIRWTKGIMIGIGVGDGAAFSAAFSPDGTSFATGHSLSTLIIWSFEPGKDPWKLKGHTGHVSSIAYSPNGQMLVSGSDDKTVRVWDIAERRQRNLFTGHTGDVNSVAFSPDNRRVASGGEDNSVKVWDIEKNELLWSAATHTERVRGVAFNRDGTILASGSSDQTVKLWDVAKGIEIGTLNAASPVCSVAFSPDGKTLASGQNGKVVLWDVAAQKESKSLKGYSNSLFSAKFNLDEKTLASGSDKGVLLWNILNGKGPMMLKGYTKPVFTIKFSPDGNTLASGGFDSTVILWDRFGTKKNTLLGHAGPIKEIAFSRDSTLLASEDSDLLAKADHKATIIVWNATSGEKIRTVTLFGTNVSNLEFSPDGKFIFAQTYGPNKEFARRLWEIATGKETRIEKDPEWKKPFEPENTITTLTGQKIEAAAEDGKIILQEREEKTDSTIGSLTEIASLISLEGGRNEWLVVTPDGHFDTNVDLARKFEGLYWILPGNLSLALPLELFMREYYEPNLLARLLSGEIIPKARDIRVLNIAQPRVEIPSISLPDTDNEVTVSVKIENGERVISREGKRITLTSGVYDLHLFRDGQLVKLAPEESQTERPRNDYDQEEIARWRTATRLVSPEQKTPTILTFKVKLPKGKDAAKSVFTAYAFNEDRIKSDTAIGEWKAEQLSQLPKAQLLRPKVYLISIGVNETGSPKWTLKYANQDARQFQKILGDGIADQDAFDVIRVPLVSEVVRGKHLNQASKENIKAVVGLLAGKKADERLVNDVPMAKQLRESTPDDVIIITISSHGFTDLSGDFYILPGGVKFADGTLDTSSLVSSDDLSRWMADVVADKIFMILDTCQSADFGGRSFKPGPMGSRGLGQLAYNKKIRILTAAKEQSYEMSDLQMSALSYVLLEKGLKRREADRYPSDSHITLRELMEYAEEEVPRFYETHNKLLQKPYLFDFVRDGTDLEITSVSNKRRN